MEFGIFYEHQLPRPWEDDSEHRLYRDALDQIELADRLGYDYVWEVEHHFLEEYSHSSAPEVFLAAAAERTEQIKIGHGIKLMPPEYNHPARVAEQVATLDLVSDGRVQFGTGESASKIELGGFDIDPDEKKAMWRETTEQVANMMTMEPYPGYEGEYFEMPTRNVVPKPVQDPHPPLWVACSQMESLEYAARNGMGALCFSFQSPADAEKWVDRYYEIFKEECVPIGHAVNPNVAMVTGFSCHPDHEEARRRGLKGFNFFRYALAYYYVFGEHVPGVSDLWNRFKREADEEFTIQDVAEDADRTLLENAIGTPEEIRKLLEAYQDAGVDQIIFVQQGGNNRHEHICESLELFAEEVMPAFHDGEASRQAAKREELEPYVEAAFDRKESMDAPDNDELTEVRAYPLDETSGEAEADD
ncbi:MAG: LLM class flavin-dependent oxidoreductase [Natronomonas sp.]